LRTLPPDFEGKQHHMSARTRRLAPLAVALLGLLVLIQAPATVSASTTFDRAKTTLIRQINKDRTDRGLVPYRSYWILNKVANSRSYDMATKHYFGHRQPDGRTAFDMIDASGITWYSAAEDIAWNNYSDVVGSAIMANNQWMGSTAHRAAILSTSYNYVGVGLQIDSSNGHRIWTAIFLKAPDHTGGWAAFDPQPDTAGDLAAEDASPHGVTVSWRGADVRLSTLTAGFDHYQVRRKIDSNSWTYLSHSTTSRSRTFTAYPGHTYRYAVRACDRRGNCGSWVYTTIAG
jgi:uncharacterized protein YkwD